MNKKILFVHIPKTAGTSFRIAAQKYFGEKHTLYDYGEVSKETTPVILECVYKEKDLFQLDQIFEQHERVFLSGHFAVSKYMSLFDTLNIVTFVREPIEQVLSHYKHFQTYYNYQNSLEEFVKEERFKNVQSKMLKAKPLELFGFIGLTEEYEKSIEMINDYYNIELETLTYNINNKHPLKRENIKDDIIDLIVENNSEDILMYNQAKKLFKKRIGVYDEQKPYVHLFIQEQSEKMIRGCAFCKYTNSPVSVELKTESGNRILLQAKSWRPGLLSQGVSRKGFIGFEYYTKDEKINTQYVKAVLSK